MFGIATYYKRKTAREINTIISEKMKDFATKQAKVNKQDFDSFAHYQGKIVTLSDLKETIKEKFNLLN